MSSRSRKARATLPAPSTADTGTDIDALEPDYGARCSVCGESPCVTGVKAGRVVYQSHLCGVCHFGTASALDPDNW